MPIVLEGFMIYPYRNYASITAALCSFTESDTRFGDPFASFCDIVPSNSMKTLAFEYNHVLI